MARLTDQQPTERSEELLSHQQALRKISEQVTYGISNIPEVKKVVLFGSVISSRFAFVPSQESGRGANRRKCRDIDLAVWVSDLVCLDKIRTASQRVLRISDEAKNAELTFAKLDMVILDHESNRYVGNLCRFEKCPADRYECMVPGCGNVPYLQRIEEFSWNTSEFSLVEQATMYDDEHLVPGVFIGDRRVDMDDDDENKERLLLRIPIVDDVLAARIEDLAVKEEISLEEAALLFMRWGAGVL